MTVAIIIYFLFVCQVDNLNLVHTVNLEGGLLAGEEDLRFSDSNSGLPQAFEGLVAEQDKMVL